MAIGTLNYAYVDTATQQTLQNNLQALQQTYVGSGTYTDRFGKEDYIRVDKGSPDKAKYVIFYAELRVEREKIVDDDPMIFVKTDVELKKECDKLVARKDVDATSIRIFGLVGAARVEFDLPEEKVSKKGK